MATKAIRDGERWAYRVAANAARSIARREAASIATVAMVESAFEAPDGLHAPCDNGKVAEASHRVLRAMLARRRNLLRGRQLEVTLKMTERGMTFHRAAKELGMTRYNVKRSFRSALRRLAKPRSVSHPTLSCEASPRREPNMKRRQLASPPLLAILLCASTTAPLDAPCETLAPWTTGDCNDQPAWTPEHVAFVTGIQDPVPVSPCQCEVVNKATPIPASDCKCETPGSGQTIPISATEEVFPDGLPDHGVCNENGCNGNNKCTYKPMSVTITIAACARTCTGHDDTDPGVDWEWSHDQSFWTTATSYGTHPFNWGQPFTMTAPSVSAANDCGSGPKKSTLTFKKKNKQTAFTLEFEFGCGTCKASRS
ncbi:MAG: sigma-70 family RNA polymerase sigma factor [Planctomycetes bacterium]|nr:sigma-70 family RNA polymerase sigma factor [Planctomycetota bacterium]